MILKGRLRLNKFGVCLMRKFKLSCVILSLMCSALFFGGVTAEEQKCEFNDLPADFEIAECYKDNGVDVVKLVSSSLSSTATAFDSLPTVFARGRDRGNVLSKLAVGSHPPYNGLIKLPDPESIIEISDAPASARSKMAQNGWSLLDMKVVVYKGPQDNDGYILVCSTLERDRSEEVIFVSQCNNFYEDDISKLKKVLLSIDG